MRGIQREIFTTAAVLGGWAMASAWTDAWADDLADLIAISPSTAGFVITMAFLIGSLAILGWGAGSAVGSPPRSIGQRAAGAIVGGVNGVLFASYVLATYRDYLADLSGRELIQSTRVARVVLDELPYAIAIGMALAVVLTIVALAVGGTGKAAPLPTGRPYPSPASKETVTYQEESWKVEPVRKPAANALEHTMPIAPVDPARYADRSGGRPSRFRGGPDQEWVHIEGARAGNTSSYLDEDDEAGSTTTVSCVACGRAVTLADVYCPWCGRLTR
jgi:hypothetical protein